jgi:hypothetical protein
MQLERGRGQLRKLTAIILATLLMAGCSETDGGNVPPFFETRVVTLDDGRQIECIAYQTGHNYGLSCDWSPR